MVSSEVSRAMYGTGVDRVRRGVSEVEVNGPCGLAQLGSWPWGRRWFFWLD